MIRSLWIIICICILCVPAVRATVATETPATPEASEVPKTAEATETPQPADAADVAEIIKKHLDARGGLDKLKAVQSVKITGKMAMGGGMEAPLVFMWKRPNKIRTEVTVQGMSAIQAYDGETAWALTPFGGATEPQKVPAEQTKVLEEQADFDGPFIDTEKKGYKLEYLGEVDTEGTPAHKFQVTDKNGQVSYHYLDAEYFLEIRSESKRKMPGGLELDLQSSSGDYKEVDGLIFAHSIEAKRKGAPAGQTVTFEKIEINPELDDSLFHMPEPKKEAEGEDAKEESENKE